jgi:hypothetical protein
MQIYTSNNSSFPDQVVPDAEKQTWEYGLKVAKAIEGEWFSNEMNNGYRFDSTYTNFHNLRLYARGEQSVQKYKDELSIDGDLSYLNLDWKPVPVLAKFVDIVVNGMSQRSYEVKTMAQDPESVKKRTEYAQRIIEDIQLQQFDAQVQQEFGIDLSQSKKDENSPQSLDELPAHMQLNYKQSIEIAEEELINQVLDKNKYHLIRKRLNYDLAVLGIAATKTTFNRSNGIVTEYVDPARIVYSYTEDPNFEDIYYVGEIRNLSLVEIKKQFPYLTAEELKKMQQYQGNKNFARNWNGRTNDQSIQVLFFEWKTYANQVWKIKETPNGLEKALEKGDTFNPPETENFKKAFRAIEVLYSGAKILGYENMLEWKLAENMTRPFSDTVKVNMSYNICAPRMYRGRIESIVSRTTGFADMINITSLKLQQVISRMVPDGVYLDVDGLAEVDLGNGTNYNPREALNMYFQTGSVVGRSLTQDGEMNRGKVPIQELQSSSGGAKIQALISTYQYYLQMIRDVTGLNEARDASTPDKNALVGLQKLAAANSNTVALQTQSIDLEDAIDIRNISNLKLANELLKKRRKQKQARDQQMQQANIQAQAQANQETAEKAALYEVQKQQAMADTQLQIEKGKSEFQIQQMQVDGKIKKELMAQQFGYDQQLKTMDLQQMSRKEKEIEDRKDERTRIQATQQSKLIDQRKNDLLPTDFETSIPENLGGAEPPLPPPPGMTSGQGEVELQPE